MDDRVEELLNAITHGFGALASLVGGVILVSLVARFGDPWEIASVTVYSVSLVLLYSASTLYHSARGRSIKRKLRVFDHCAIYVLIAGSYTPFALGPLRGPWGWTSLAAVWVFAGLGIGHRCFRCKGIGHIPARSYLAMAWVCLIPFVPFLGQLATATLLFLALGGVAYTAGTIFYNSRRIRFAHPIWHGFVLAGSAAHFAAIMIQMTG